MNISRYTRQELTKTARAAVKGRGIYRRWELQIVKPPGSGDAVSLVVFFTCNQDGRSAQTNVAI